MRYYYAVVECDSLETASAIYNQCDGFDYQGSSNLLDLRFIPDEEQFSASPRDVATEVGAGYVPTVYVARALQRSKVPLSWDEDPRERVRMLRRNWADEDLSAVDLRDYLASGSDEEETKAEERLVKYKHLLSVGEDAQARLPSLSDSSEGEVDKEMTFRSEVQVQAVEKTSKIKRPTEQLKSGNAQPPDAQAEKRRRGQLELLTMDSSSIGLCADDSDQDDHRSKKKSKKNKKEKDEFEVDLKDPRFAALFEQPEYALDPTNPQFKRTKAAERILGERHKRIRDKSSEIPTKSHPTAVPSQGVGGLSTDLSSLVASVRKRLSNIIRKID